MTRSEWSDFLGAWQEAAMLLISLIPGHVIDQSTKTAMFSSRPMKEPATDCAISAIESRLQCDIPVDLANFFLVSNGWCQYGFDEYDLEILPVGDAYYLSGADERLREGVSGYAENVENDPNRRFFRKGNLGKVVLLSDHKSGCYLMNLADPLGECAVVRWQFAPRLYASFSDLMMSEKNRCLNGLRSMLD